MRVKVLLCSLTLTVVAFPRTSHAGLLDVLWEMSGPQLVGIGLQCEFGLERSVKPECDAFGKRVGAWNSHADRRVWVDLLTAAYFSTGRDNEDNGQPIRFSAGRVRMIGVDPMLAMKVIRRSQHRFHAGTGLSLNFFFGPDFDTFTNVAIKLRPVGWDWDRAIHFLGQELKLGAAYNLRVYPDGFDASPTGGLATSGEPEAVHGFTVGLSF